MRLQWYFWGLWVFVMTWKPRIDESVVEPYCAEFAAREALVARRRGDILRHGRTFHWLAYR
jgi:hypothetical protein